MKTKTYVATFYAVAASALLCGGRTEAQQATPTQAIKQDTQLGEIIVTARKSAGLQIKAVRKQGLVRSNAVV